MKAKHQMEPLLQMKVKKFHYEAMSEEKKLQRMITMMCWNVNDEETNWNVDIVVMSMT